MNTPLKILVLDNNREEKSYGSNDLVHWALKTAPIGSEVVVRRPPDQDLPLDLEFDALVLSGSVTSCLEWNEPWVKPYDDFVSQQIAAEKPILGVCYGHQTLARCLFRMQGEEPKLRVATDAELGWVKIKKTETTPLFDGLKNEFLTYQSHYEEVSELPPGTQKLAETDRCSIQAFAVLGKPIYGIQFHPEYSVKDAEASLAAKLKKGIRKDWILNAGRGPKLYDENVGNIIFGNFFKIADQSRKPEQATSVSFKERIKLILKFALVGVVFFYMYKKGIVTADSFHRLFSSPKTLVICLFFMIMNALLGAMRWRVLLDTQGAHLPFLRVLELNLVGSFFNIALRAP